MECSQSSKKTKSEYETEYRILKGNLEKLKINISKQSKDDPLTIILSEKQNKLENAVKEAKAGYESYIEAEKDPTPELKDDIMIAENIMQDLTEKINSTGDGPLKLSLIDSHEVQYRRKEHAEHKLEVHQVTQHSRTLDDLFQKETEKIHLSLPIGKHAEARRQVKRQMLNQQYRNTMEANYQQEDFQPISQHNHQEVFVPTRSPAKAHPCRYGPCNWVGDHARARLSHEKRCRHR